MNLTHDIIHTWKKTVKNSVPLHFLLPVLESIVSPDAIL